MATPEHQEHLGFPVSLENLAKVMEQEVPEALAAPTAPEAEDLMVVSKKVPRGHLVDLLSIHGDHLVSLDENGPLQRIQVALLDLRENLVPSQHLENLENLRLVEDKSQQGMVIASLELEVENLELGLASLKRTVEVEWEDQALGLADLDPEEELAGQQLELAGREQVASRVMVDLEVLANQTLLAGLGPQESLDLELGSAALELDLEYLELEMVLESLGLVDMKAVLVLEVQVNLEHLADLEHLAHLESVAGLELLADPDSLAQ